MSKSVYCLVAIGIAAQALLMVVYYKIATDPHSTSQTQERFDTTLVTSKHKGLLVDWKTIKHANGLEKDIDWKNVPKKPKPQASALHDKWVVVTTINKPTDDVKKLAAMDGWKVVVVGDTKTPADWSHPNCVFLSVERQKKLGYRITELLPYKSYTRKNIGFLYAIQHGAKYIYDTDDDNHPTGGKVTFFEKEKGEFHVYKTSSTIVNPYANFGQGSIWPRGYPLESISEPIEKTFVKCQNVQATIQQGVVDGDPDVDAIFRLTRKDKDVRLDVKFDHNSPPLALPPGTMAPYNSQNTFFHKNALWSLLLPVSTNFRVCDIWRGYWGQRLLWEVGGHLSFFPPNAYQHRNAHSYLLDFIDEKPLYHDAGRLVKFLVKWKSNRKDFFSRVLDLSVSMVSKRFVGPMDAILTEAWLYDLISVGYDMPELNATPKTCDSVSKARVVLEPKEQPSSYLLRGKNLVNIISPQVSPKANRK